MDFTLNDPLANATTHKWYAMPEELRPWKAAESTQLKNEAVTFLLKYHIEWAGDSLVVVESLSCDAAVDLIGEEAMESSSKYPTLTR